MDPGQFNSQFNGDFAPAKALTLSEVQVSLLLQANQEIQTAKTNGGEAGEKFAKLLMFAKERALRWVKRAMQ